MKKETKNNWLPSTYIKPIGNSRYMKFKKGDNKFRILSAPLIGWVDWDKTGEKPVPVRTREQQLPLNEETFSGEQQKPKHFWAFSVWDYEGDGAIKILEITQASIRDEIFNLYSSEDWGDPRGYGINVKREGEKLETKYYVTPSPPKPLDERIEKAYADENINLEVLFDNGDPFGSSDTQAKAEKEEIEQVKEDFKKEDPIKTPF